ncbi:MAG: hypothetical protein HY775_02035 [Acidobacteria bacterium]|nr:hypothetical protein [Acidobacteriota bacterium]
MEPLQSIDPVTHEVEREGEVQARHFEALDTKAGAVLGFAGVLVALGERCRGSVSTFQPIPS